MKTNWDFTKLAQAYLKRPDYSSDAIDEMLSNAEIQSGAHICDVGAGTAHLTLKLEKRGMVVKAVEPNDEMRRLGFERTKDMEAVQWFEGVAEETGQPSNMFDMVTFGASFNVTDRQAALKETKRILKSNGWLAAMFNYRELNDPIQKEIENIINEAIPGYKYGIRRKDQTPAINESGYFKTVQRINKKIMHHQLVDDVVEAWRSHATLHRQAGDKFCDIINQIKNLLMKNGQTEISIPYTTSIWFAQVA